MHIATQRSESFSSTSRIKNEDPSRYIADQALKDAIQVATVLQKPLLVTGEPGTGKTQLASYLTWWLNQQNRLAFVDGPLMFEAKSTSAARDLFYSYDTLGRFQARQLGIGSENAVDYITYNALGIAIVNANEKDQKLDRCLPKRLEFRGPVQSVVLIDEIDKAPRDFPNDILNEIDNNYFRIPELPDSPVIAAPPRLRPFLVITSNSEKNLPAAFLRRCIYYNIPSPTPDRLMDIVCARIAELAEYRNPFLAEALDLFGALREPSSGLQKKPATAELLDWLSFLHTVKSDFRQSLRTQPSLLNQCLTTLIKNAADTQNAKAVVEAWIQAKRNGA